jgi:hypothetical protein
MRKVAYLLASLSAVLACRFLVYLFVFLVYRSEPNAGENSVLALTDNNTWSCAEDVEKLRQHLNISKWHCVFGGMETNK